MQWAWVWCAWRILAVLHHGSFAAPDCKFAGGAFHVEGLGTRKTAWSSHPAASTEITSSCPLALAGSFSIAFSVRFDGVLHGAYLLDIGLRGHQDGIRVTTNTRSSRGSLAVSLSDSSRRLGLEGPTPPVRVATRHLITFTDSGELQWWEDGSLVGKTAAAPGLFLGVPLQHVLVGRGRDESTPSFHGLLEDVWLWKRAISWAEAEADGPPPHFRTSGNHRAGLATLATGATSLDGSATQRITTESSSATTTAATNRATDSSGSRPVGSSRRWEATHTSRILNTVGKRPARDVLPPGQRFLAATRRAAAEFSMSTSLPKGLSVVHGIMAALKCGTLLYPHPYATNPPCPGKDAQATTSFLYASTPAPTTTLQTAAPIAGGGTVGAASTTAALVVSQAPAATAAPLGATTLVPGGDAPNATTILATALAGGGADAGGAATTTIRQTTATAGAVQSTTTGAARDSGDNIAPGDEKAIWAAAGAFADDLTSAIRESTQSLVASLGNRTMASLETELGVITVLSAEQLLSAGPQLFAAAGGGQLALTASFLESLPAGAMLSVLSVDNKGGPSPLAAVTSARGERTLTPVIDISLGTSGNGITQLPEPLLFRLPDGPVATPADADCAFLKREGARVFWSREGVRKASTAEVLAIGQNATGAWCVTKHLSIFVAITRQIVSCTNLELWTPKAAEAVKKNVGWWRNKSAILAFVSGACMLLVLLLGVLREIWAYRLGSTNPPIEKVCLCRKFMSWGPQLIKHKYAAFLIFTKEVMQCLAAGRSKLRRPTLVAAVQRCLAVRTGVATATVAKECWSGGGWTESVQALPRTVICAKLKFNAGMVEDVILNELNGLRITDVLIRYLVTLQASHPLLDATRVGASNMSVWKRVSLHAATLLGVLATYSMILTFTGPTGDWMSDGECFIEPKSHGFVLVATMMSMICNAVPNAFLQDMAKQVYGRRGWTIFFWSLVLTYILIASTTVLIALSNLHPIDQPVWYAAMEWAIMIKFAALPMAQAFRHCLLLEFFLFEGYKNEERMKNLLQELGQRHPEEKDHDEEVEELKQQLARQAISAEDLVNFCALLGDKVMLDFDPLTSTSDDVVEGAIRPLCTAPPELDAMPLTVEVQEVHGLHMASRSLDLGRCQLSCTVLHLGRQSFGRRPAMQESRSSAANLDADEKNGAMKSCSWGYEANVMGLRFEHALGFQITDDNHLIGTAILPAEAVLKEGGYTGELLLQSPGSGKAFWSSSSGDSDLNMGMGLGPSPRSQSKNTGPTTPSGADSQTLGVGSFSLRSFSKNTTGGDSQTLRSFSTWERSASKQSSATPGKSPTSICGRVSSKITVDRQPSFQVPSQVRVSGVSSHFSGSQGRQPAVGIGLSPVSRLVVKVSIPNGYLRALALHERMELSLEDETIVPDDSLQCSTDLVRWAEQQIHQEKQMGVMDPLGRRRESRGSNPIQTSCGAFCMPTGEESYPPERMVVHSRSTNFVHLVAVVLCNALGNETAYNNVRTLLTERQFMTVLDLLRQAAGEHRRYWIDIFSMDVLSGHCALADGDHWHEQLMAAMPTVVRHVKQDCCMQMVADMEARRPATCSLPMQLIVLDEGAQLFKEPLSVAEVMLAKSMHLHQHLVLHPSHLKAEILGVAMRKLSQDLHSSKDVFGGEFHWAMPHLDDGAAVFEAAKQLVIKAVKVHKEDKEETWQELDLADIFATGGGFHRSRTGMGQDGANGGTTEDAGMDETADFEV